MAMVTSFVLINSEPSRTAALAESLADLPEVAEVYSVAGEYDLVAVVRVRHHDDLADVVTKHIAALDGIVRTRTLIAFRAYSRADLDAMWAIGVE
ncbi:MAG TPA: Lrp/AsnC ligand binding domain-containing protein [Acidimicrobiales bacterium]